MTGNPSVCTLQAGASGTCVCAPGWSGFDKTFCDRTCDLAAIPSINASENEQQAPWLCAGSPTAVFVGSTCTAECYLQGPGLNSAAQLACRSPGVWVAVTQCENVTKFADNNHTYWLQSASLMPWSRALQYAAMFTYKGSVGQLPVVLSLAENKFIASLADPQTDRLWLGGARNESYPRVGAFWATGKLRGTQFFFGDATQPLPAPPGKNSSLFSYFRPENEPAGPPSSAGAMRMTLLDHGFWLFEGKENFEGAYDSQLAGFVVEFDPEFTQPWELIACGALGICLCVWESTRLAVVCPTLTLFDTIPRPPIETYRFTIEVNGVQSNVVPRGEFAVLEIFDNKLSKIPVTANGAPLLNLTTLSLLNNQITALPSDALALLGPNLKSIDLRRNNITAVAHGALAALSINFSATSFRMDSNPTVCTASKKTINCTCAAGYMTEPRWPTFCVPASVFAGCQAALKTLTSFNTDATPGLVCTFTSANVTHVSCSSVCPDAFVSSSPPFTCVMGQATRAGVVFCKSPYNKTAAPSSSNVPAAAGGAVGGVLVLVVLVLLVVVTHRRRRATPSLQQQLEQLLAEKVEKTFLLAFAGQFSEGALTQARHDFAALEVPRKNVKFGRLIGQGQSGEVFAGYLLRRGSIGASTQIPVAIKRQIVLGSTVNTAGEEALQLESRLLCQLKHAHMIQVLAIVSTSFPTLLCLEFMANGDLKTYLRACRPTLKVRKQEISAKDFVGVLTQVCDALSFLEQHRVVHRDIAARNVLVGADLALVKLGDLGATRVLDEREYYRQRSAAQVPLKWMAPECIEEAKYTTASDVWAFGVLAYEVTSFAMTPYGALGAQELVAELKKGYRLPQPPACPATLYALMSDCWQTEASRRPAFSTLLNALQQLEPTKVLTLSRETAPRHTQYAEDDAKRASADGRDIDGLAHPRDTLHESSVL